MAAHKVRATARAIDGSEVVVYPETLAGQVLCIIPDETGEGNVGGDGEPTTTEKPLDELLNELADEINANTQSAAEHEGALQLLTRPSYAVCDTAGNVVAKAVSLSPFILEVGGEITVKFTNTNTTPAATLNVANTGAKPILYKGQPLPGGLLSGVQKFNYDGTSWNIVGDFDTNTDTTYDVMSVDEAKSGSAITPRTLTALNLKQVITDISQGIVDSSLADNYDVGGLQVQLNNLIFQLAVQGVLDGSGLDAVVTIDSASDLVLVSGMYSAGKVYI